MSWPRASRPRPATFDIPWRTSFKTSASYALPAGFRIGVVFQSISGAERAILYAVDRTVLSTLVQPSVNVRLNEPGTEYDDRVHQFDVNLGKTFNVANLRIAPQIEFFNIFNANPVTTQVSTYGSSLGRPLTVLVPRLVRLGVQVNF